MLISLNKTARVLDSLGRHLSGRAPKGGTPPRHVSKFSMHPKARKRTFHAGSDGRASGIRSDA